MDANPPYNGTTQSKDKTKQNKTKPQCGNMWFHTSFSLGLFTTPGNANGIPPTGRFRVRGFLHATLEEFIGADCIERVKDYGGLDVS